ncbi:nuclear transport factor 2 family protein [Nocardia sp. NPDC004860]|uniref:nuclear transport factor 2 family protein n=1 Tax=Nocardia sp. NPDC004860 TaxID=3154557 RepID=UPI00339E6F1B
MLSFPPVRLQSALSAHDRIDAIDFVNRVNWLFEVWDVDGMVESFLPDGAAIHFDGSFRGHKEIRAFFEERYRHLIPGVARHATNHIVDEDGPDGVAVRYHMMLVRYAFPDTGPGVPLQEAIVNSMYEVPSIWLYSPMLDRLRRTDNGWRVFERYLGPSVFNQRLSPPQI